VLVQLLHQLSRRTKLQILVQSEVFFVELSDVLGCGHFAQIPLQCLQFEVVAAVVVREYRYAVL
jgi:hypothetical protein